MVGAGGINESYCADMAFWRYVDLDSFEVVHF